MVNHRHLLTFLVFHLVADDDEVHGTSTPGFLVDLVDGAEQGELVAWSHWYIELQITSPVKPDFANLGRCSGVNFLARSLVTKVGGATKPP